MEPTQGPLTIDSDYIAADRTANLIMSILDGYIPTRCKREAHQWIFEACYKEGFELTSKIMRKEYEAWKALTLKGLEPSSLSVKPGS